MRRKNFNPTDILNKKFDKLTVIKFIGTKRVSNVLRYFYLCECECGRKTEVVSYNLTGKSIKSCGCGQRKTGKQSYKWSGLGDISGTFWRNLRRGARIRNLSFNLTKKDIWDKFLQQNGKCAYTDWDLTFKISVSKLSKQNEQTASLDRIDSSKGYEIDNVQWVHKDINRAKQIFSNDYFIKMCLAVAKKHLV